MKKTLAGIFIVLTIVSCGKKEPCTDCGDCGVNLNVREESMDEAISRSKSGELKAADTAELSASIAKIEEKYGEQWDFCHCVVVNDSIDKAIKAGNTDDALLERWDYVDKKCQAFRIQDPNRTPEQRALHEKKVKKCLKDAGVRN